jgi:transcriptional regulator with XRE-family HTH domain
MTKASTTVREQRLRRGWTQEDLVSRCSDAGVHVTYSAISRIERGVHIPRPKLRAVLAELLELDINDFEEAS